MPAAMMPAAEMMAVAMTAATTAAATTAVAAFRDRKVRHAERRCEHNRGNSQRNF